MKKTLRGFTLVELLITMAIVGAVAALTIPGLVSGTNKASTGPELARVVERLEVGLRNVIDTANKNIVEEGGEPTNELMAIQIKDLFPSQSSETYIIGNSDADRNLFGNTGSLTGVEEFDKDNPTFSNTMPGYFDSIKSYSGGEKTANIIYDTLSPYKVKKSNAIIVPYVAPSLLTDDKIKADSMIGHVFVDINGDKKPNKEGQDIFLFGILNNGHLIPAGIEEFNDGWSEIYSVDLNVPLKEDGCSGDTITNGLSCTARVAANGWKVDY